MAFWELLPSHRSLLCPKLIENRRAEAREGEDTSPRRVCGENQTHSHSLVTPPLHNPIGLAPGLATHLAYYL